MARPGLYEFRAARPIDGAPFGDYGGYVEADNMADALARIAALGFVDPTYLAFAVFPEPGGRIYRKDGAA